MDSVGKIYMVATPIGNLGDFTFRAVDVLSNANLIAAEDTRTTKILLQHYKIKTPLESLHNYNEEKKAKRLISLCKDNNYNIAIVSDAGTPNLNDPGFSLLHEAYLKNVPAISIPGASSLTATIAISCIPVNQFTYMGFMPKTPGKRMDCLKKCYKNPLTSSFLFLETPHQIQKTITDLNLFITGEEGIKGKLQIFKELTKRHESTLLLDFTQLGEFDPQSFVFKGEFTLLLYFEKDKVNKIDGISDTTLQNIERDYQILCDTVTANKEIYAYLVQKYQIRKKELYSYLHATPI